MNKVPTDAPLRIAAALLLCAVLLGTTILAPGTLPGPPAVLAADEGGDDDGGDDDDDDGGGQQVPFAEEPVTATEPRGVDVNCDRDAQSGRSTCVFAPVGTTDPVLDLLVPVQGICADVAGGDYEADPPDTGAGGPAYYSVRPGESEVVLVLAGEVSTAGATIYWVETGTGRQPAAGLGLTCAIQAVATPAPTQTPPAATTTGSITVRASRCDVSAPPAAAPFDWYGECVAPGDDLAFDLSLGDGAKPVETLRADDDGIAVFTALDPGKYRLEEVGGDWCHAESDSVDASGNVVVDAGTETTVWTFHCVDVQDVK